MSKGNSSQCSVQSGAFGGSLNYSAHDAKVLDASLLVCSYTYAGSLSHLSAFVRYTSIHNTFLGPSHF